MRVSPSELDDYKPAGMEALEVLHNQLQLLVRGMEGEREGSREKGGEGGRKGEREGGKGRRGMEEKGVRELKGKERGGTNKRELRRREAEGVREGASTEGMDIFKGIEAWGKIRIWRNREAEA